MKKLYLMLAAVVILALLASCSDNIPPVQTNSGGNSGANTTPGSEMDVYLEGAYESLSDSKSAYMRFYNDGTVIAVTSGANADRDKIMAWFDRDSANVSAGTYQINGSTLSGSYESSADKGKPISFTGTINPDGSLDLHIISSINNFESDEVFTLFQGAGLVNTGTANVSGDNADASGQSNGGDKALEVSNPFKNEQVLEDTGSFEYEYSISLDGVVIRRYLGKNPHIVIPSEIEGYPVVGIIGALNTHGFTTPAFDENLVSVTIPDSVTWIGDSTFEECASLMYVNIPVGVTKIGAGTFSGCASLASIHIPGSITEIGGGAFYNCVSLASITIPNSVTNIGPTAFTGCTSLTSVTIPAGVKEIGMSAFSDCALLTSVTIPDSVTKIHASAFSGCTSLKSITIPSGVVEIGGSAFKDCTSLTSVTILGSVRNIAEYTFKGCTSLTSISIPNGVTKIDPWAFESCNTLASVTLPDGIEEIGMYAFYQCASLTAINIPGSLTKIGEGAFMEVESLPIKTQAEIKQINRDAFGL